MNHVYRLAFDYMLIPYSMLAPSYNNLQIKNSILHFGNTQTNLSLFQRSAVTRLDFYRYIICFRTICLLNYEYRKELKSIGHVLLQVQKFHCRDRKQSIPCFFGTRSSWPAYRMYFRSYILLLSTRNKDDV